MDLISWFILYMGVRRGGQEGGLAPPSLAGQNSMFFDFLNENTMF